MVDVKVAVENAAKYAKEWLGSSDAVLEQVEPSKSRNEDVWLESQKWAPTSSRMTPTSISSCWSGTFPLININHLHFQFRL
jgi:hypothetical protein